MVGLPELTALAGVLFMMTNIPKPWWKRRRFWWPLVAVLAVGGAATVARFDADASRIIVYNQTGDHLATVTIVACGQTKTFRDIDDDVSVRFKLLPTGGASAITIRVNGEERWQGDYIEPGGGYRAIIRLGRHAAVTCRNDISWWR